MVVSCRRIPGLIPVCGLDRNGPPRRRARPTTSTLSVPLGRRGSQTSAAHETKYAGRRRPRTQGGVPQRATALGA